MAERLRDAVSAYLRGHADNPVDWWPWGTEPFAEAKRRGVPVLVSIGYATCHWCHVMARESFSDPELASWLNERFVAVKVDREEHPEVDTAYLGAAGAFTGSLGWPLTVFATPAGRVFHAGTYFPPVAGRGLPSFRQVLEAVDRAWREQPDELERSAVALSEAVTASVAPEPGALPDAAAFEQIVADLLAAEDPVHGGLGGAPKFPMAPVLLGLLDRGDLGDDRARALAERCLDAMAASPLRDAVEGGFFRYATRADWHEPHYERMLTDNALLLIAYARSERRDIAEGIAEFLIGVMRLPTGFASGQDSESMVTGQRMEGVYYRLSDRSQLEPPPLDDKVLTGWNGLAIEALALAGARLGHAEWVAEAASVADTLLATHRRADGTLLRASSGARTSRAAATLEDYGMLAAGLVQLSLATGEVRYAVAARELIEACLPGEGVDDGADDAADDDGVAVDRAAGGAPFTVPGGADPQLAEAGLAVEFDPSEGAYPSGASAAASAALQLHLLSGDARLLRAAELAMERFAPMAVRRPLAFGAALSVMSGLTAEPVQLVVVATDSNDRTDPLVAAARSWSRPGAVSLVVSEAQAQAFAAAGFELLEGRALRSGASVAYLCRDFVCRLPVTDAAELILPARRTLPWGGGGAKGGGGHEIGGAALAAPTGRTDSSHLAEEVRVRVLSIDFSREVAVATFAVRVVVVQPSAVHIVAPHILFDGLIHEWFRVGGDHLAVLVSAQLAVLGVLSPVHRDVLGAFSHGCDPAVDDGAPPFAGLMTAFLDHVLELAHVAGGLQVVELQHGTDLLGEGLGLPLHGQLHVRVLRVDRREVHATHVQRAVGALP